MPLLAQSPLVRPFLRVSFLLINCSVDQQCLGLSLWIWLRCSGRSSPPCGDRKVLGTFLWGPLASLVCALRGNRWHRRSGSGGGRGWASQSRGCPRVSVCLPALSIPVCSAAGQPQREWGRHLGARCPRSYGMALGEPRYWSMPQFPHHYSTPLTYLQFNLQSDAKSLAILEAASSYPREEEFCRCGETPTPLGKEKRTEHVDFFYFFFGLPHITALTIK